MGGSGNYGGGGFGGGGGSADSCDKSFSFLVTIPSGSFQTVWDAVSVGDNVEIKATTTAVPKLTVERYDGLDIGVLPPQVSGVIECMKKGWSYKGTVTSKDGSVHAPRIRVKVKGEL